MLAAGKHTWKAWPPKIRLQQRDAFSKENRTEAGLSRQGVWKVTYDNLMVTGKNIKA